MSSRSCAPSRGYSAHTLLGGSIPALLLTVAISNDVVYSNMHVLVLPASCMRTRDLGEGRRQEEHQDRGS